MKDWDGEYPNGFYEVIEMSSDSIKSAESIETEIIQLFNLLEKDSKQKVFQKLTDNYNSE